jgi:hypothetical protein
MISADVKKGSPSKTLFLEPVINIMFTGCGCDRETLITDGVKGYF